MPCGMRAAPVKLLVGIWLRSFRSTPRLFCIYRSETLVLDRSPAKGNGKWFPPTASLPKPHKVKGYISTLQEDHQNSDSRELNGTVSSSIISSDGSMSGLAVVTSVSGGMCRVLRVPQPHDRWCISSILC